VADARQQLKQDALVTTLRKDPSERPEDFKLLTGWLGESTHKGMYRLYPTPELDEFVEFDESAVLGSWPVGKAAPLGGTIVALSSAAELKGMGSETISVKAASMLGGDSTERFTRVASALTSSEALTIGGGLGDKDYTQGFWCNVSLLFACTTHVVDNWVCTLASGKLCGTAKFLP
jgi:hypothetical protein